MRKVLLKFLYLKVIIILKISQVITVNQKDADEEFLFLSKLMKGRFTKERGYSMGSGFLFFCGYVN